MAAVAAAVLGFVIVAWVRIPPDVRRTSPVRSEPPSASAPLTQVPTGDSISRAASGAREGRAELQARLEHSDPADDEERETLLCRLVVLAPGEALAHAWREADPVRRNHLLQRVTTTWLQNDTLSAARWLLESGDSELQSQVGPLAATELARRDARTAANFVAALPPQVRVEDMLGPVLDTWGRTELSVALAWAQQLPPGEFKTGALLQLDGRWLQDDPWSALAYAQRENPGDARLLVTLVSRWAALSPADALAWAAQLPEGEQRDKVMPSLAGALAQRSPAAAVQLVQGLSPGEARTEAAIAVVSTWARQDPEVAAQWAAQLPSGSGRERALTQAATIWAQLNPVGAAQWAASLAGNADLDAAISAVSGVLAERDPATARLLAESITDETLRRARLQNLSNRATP